MFNQLPTNGNAAIRSLLPSSAPLTSGQAASLKAILAGPRYAGQTPQQACALINATYMIDNPVAQTTVPITTMSKQQFDTGIGAELLAAVIALPADNPARAAILQDYQYAVPMIGDPVSFDNSLFKGIIAAIVASGALSQDKADGLFLQLDPKWTAKIRANDAETIVGVGGWIEVSDIVEVSDIASALG